MDYKDDDELNFDEYEQNTAEDVNYIENDGNLEEADFYNQENEDNTDLVVCKEENNVILNDELGENDIDVVDNENNIDLLDNEESRDNNNEREIEDDLEARDSDYDYNINKYIEENNSQAVIYTNTE